MNLKDTPYWTIFAEVFTVFKKSMPVEGTDEYWEKVGEKTIELFNKYETTEYADFAKDLLVAVHTELGRLYDKGR